LLDIGAITTNTDDDEVLNYEELFTDAGWRHEILESDEMRSKEHKTERRARFSY